MSTEETKIVFRRSGGHSHDGLASSLIDTTKYSLFDFTPALNGQSGSPRRRFQLNNESLIKKFIVDTVEERVLNPEGITLSANVITAREIVAGTITSDELSSNLVLINNIIRSSTFNGSFYANGVINSSGTTGWAISHAGESIFNNVTIRGNITGGSSIDINSGVFTVNSSGTITATSGTIGGWHITSTSLYSGSTTLYSNGQITNGTTTIYANGDFSASSGVFSGSLSGASITGATGTFSGAVLVSDGSNGVEITTDGYIRGTGGNGVRIKNSDGSTGATKLFKDIIYSTTIDSALFIVSNGSEHFEADINGVRIQTSGQRPLRLNRDYPGSNSHFITFYSTTAGANVGNIAFSGSGGVGFNSASDRRLKENVKLITEAIDIVKKMEPVEYNFISDSHAVQHGFIAQDLYSVYPYPVSIGGENPKDNPWGVDYSKLTPILTAGLREVINKLESIENRLNAIEGV